MTELTEQDRIQHRNDCELLTAVDVLTMPISDALIARARQDKELNKFDSRFVRTFGTNYLCIYCGHKWTGCNAKSCPNCNAVETDNVKFSAEK